MRSEKEVKEKIEKLNEIVRKLQANHKHTDVSESIAYLYTQIALNWVLSDGKESLAIEEILEGVLES